MDFKSLISKIESIDGKIDTVKAPELPKSVQLNEDAQLRVLSGRSTYVAEAKKKAEEDVKEADDMKVGDKKNIATGTVEKTKTGMIHKSSKAYGGSEEKEADDEDDKPKKKAKKESVEPEFKSKFMKMVEAKKEEAADKKKKMAKKEKMAEGSKPDFLDIDKDGDKKEPMKKAAADKGDDKPAGKKGMSDKQAKYFGKKTVKEASDDDADFDNISHGVSSPEEKKKQEKSMIDTFKKSGKKANPDSQIGRLMKKHGVSLESKMMPKGKKRPVKESVETKLSFKQMVQLVQESGGQQQIDAVDKALFTWAQRVATSKLGEGMKADLYAGLVYERNGGVFEMYDVLSESKKRVVESRVQLDEGMMDKVKSLLMSKLAPKLSDQEKDKMASVAKSVLGKDRADKSDFTLANIKAIAKALGAKPEPAAESIEEGPIGDFFGQKKVDPKSGQGTLGGIDAWDKSATLGEKLSSLTGVLGGAAATIAGLFGGPAWLIIPGILAIMFMSQIGMSKGGSY